tara:strand:- start:1358 stop:1681 length:324 start_codon:yes stop_codon:yes gene_type:complete
MRFWIFNLIIYLFFQAFAQRELSTLVTQTTLIVLGIAQDDGIPQINFTKNCCKALLCKKKDSSQVIFLGVIDPINNTNPLLNSESKESKQIIDLGFHLARTGDRLIL